MCDAPSAADAVLQPAIIAKYRRRAASIGLRLLKSRSRTPENPNHGGYMIIDVWTSTIVAGDDHCAFSLDLDDLDDWFGSGFATTAPERARDGSWRI